MPTDQSVSSSDALASGPSLVANNPAINQHEDEQVKMLDFTSARIHLDRIIRDWDTEVEDTEVRRKLRKVEIDVEGLRQKNEFDEDETLVPVRVIDSNITREQPPFINYLKNSRRTGIFECLSVPGKDNDLIEQEFTRVSTYTAWEIPLFKVKDGSDAHGWDAVEIVLDEDKPGNFSIEHIGHDKLLFPRSAIDIQKCPRIIRCYDVSILQLQDWIKRFGFDGEQVELIRKSRRDTQKENENVRVYKMFFKLENVVQVAWFCMSDGCKDWLKKPMPHYVGIDEQSAGILGQMMFTPKPLDMYPVFLLYYRETEESKIVDHKGRCFLDEAKQEAQTALWSSFINGMNRASNVYASPDTEDGTGAALKELEDVVLRNGKIFNRPMKFFHMDYPDPVVLRTLQQAEVANDQEVGQVNFASLNREDSRKTATEIGAAQQQQSLLNSVQLTLFSTFIRQIYSFAWLIVQSQALQNKIVFLQIPQQQPDPATGQNVIVGYTNDTVTIGLVYSVRAAGDVDVVQKQEIEQKMQQDWAMVAQTPLGPVFMADYIKYRYPDKADKYGKVLGQQDQVQQLKGLVGQLSTMLEGTLKDAPHILQQLTPQEQSAISQTMAQAKQINESQ